VATDESKLYRTAGTKFAAHETVHHSKGQWAKGDLHTNNAEAFYGVFRRDMRGIYRHCGERHLHRYVAEFDFRYSNRVALGVDDMTRTTRAIPEPVGR